MAFNLNKHKEDLLFMPFGGAGEIGMNLNIYHLDGELLMVDCGAGFAEDFLPGIDMIVPDIDYILENQDKLLGIVLTHAHEDHLGAIVYLLEYLQCPIYATPFTAEFLRLKIAENDPKANLEIVVVDPGSSFKVGSFDIELVQITHSVPEMNAVVLRTRYGNVFHSGDWKLDPDPLVGGVSDQEKLEKYGDEGVVAFVGDSTNVFSPGSSGSEGELRKSLCEIISKCDKQVVVTTFASNVARIETVAEAAKKTGRKLVLCGRALWRVVKAAKACGYFADDIEFLDGENISGMDRDGLVVLATGCQGEPLATVSKLANQCHKYVKIRPGDTVIFSSKIIPGNEKKIFRLFNKFAKMGVEIVTEKDHFVHVSGHPNRDDVRRMYDWVKPKFCIPVHGEAVHMREHARMAKAWGINAVEVANGDVVKIDEDGCQKLAVVDSGILAVDGNMFLEPNGKILKMRRKMQRDGLILVCLVLDGAGLCARPVVSAPGALDDDADAEAIDDIVAEVESSVGAAFTGKRSKPLTEEYMSNMVRSAVRRVLTPYARKKPPIEVFLRWV